MAPSKLASLHRILPQNRSLHGRLLGALVLASSLLGCATQAQTGQLMSAVGTAAVIAGAIAADDGCNAAHERGYERGSACDRGGMSGSEKVGLAVAVAGLATAAVGNALQEDAARLDARRRVYQGPTYTPTTLPPPAYAPAGTFHPFLTPTVVQTTSCTCAALPATPPPAAPPCAATSSESAATTPENTSSAEASPETEATGCPCAVMPASSAPSEEGSPEAAPEEAAPSSEPEQAAPAQ